ncbi:MAG: glutamate--tRNA ligase [Candidatus Diapherotrites archaeon]|nr:glutamate--tRNA ligase [Candidatus Diapherotrites archaeon]
MEKDYLYDAYRYAIKNAYLHNGRADTAAVISKVAALHKDIKIRDILAEIKEIIEKVNTMTYTEIEKEYKKFESSYELRPIEKTPGLPKLEWAEREKVVTRFAPNPNGPFHLGNARAAILSAEYAKMYNGIFYLRFDDTDPKIKKPLPNAEQIYKEDLEWLGYTPDKIFFASDRLETYYSYMKKAIEMGIAYVCDCDTETWKKKIENSEACKCRNLQPKENLLKFEKMLKNEIKEGEAVLRIKTDLNHKDPSVRDWWAAKCVDKPEHPNEKARSKHVWPSYNFASAIDDHELGISLIIRGQEHEQNATKQKFLYDYFGWKYPHTIHFGRIAIEGIILSTSRTKEGIERGLYKGWDDPRLGTIRALRRRGFHPKALVDAIIELGIRPNDASISEAKLADLNKKYIDSESKRINYIKNPVILDVVLCPQKEIEKDGIIINLHDGQQRFYINQEDFEYMKEGMTIRLRNLYNVKITNKSPMQIFAQYVGEAKIEKNVISWIVDPYNTIIVKPDASEEFGIIERRETKKGERFHLEKEGYAIVDYSDYEKVVFYLTHK